MEQPGHDCPASSSMNPRFARLLGDQRSNRERERHRESDVAQIQHGRMDHHRPVLQKRVQTSAHALDDIAAAGDQHRKRAQYERDQDQEESLSGHQDRGDPRHHVAKLPAIHEDHNRRIGSQNPRPQQQRSFLAAPPGRELIDRRHGRVSVRRDVAKPEVANDEGIDQEAGSDGK